jgi:hypothetical protein
MPSIALSVPFFQPSVDDAKRPENLALADGRPHLPQRQMGRDQGHAKASAKKRHGVILCAGEFCQGFGVTGIRKTRQIPGLLGNGGRDQGIGFSRLDEAHTRLHAGEGGFPARGRDLSPLDTFWAQPARLHDFQVLQPLQMVSSFGSAQEARGLGQDFPVPNDDQPANLGQGRVGSRAEDDFWTDSGGIALREGDGGQKRTLFRSGHCCL